jgi:SulP family sulfate permease
MLASLLIVSFVAARYGWSLPSAGGKTAVSVVGAIPAALPSFHLPDFSFGLLWHLLNGALAIALLGLLEALAVAKSIATYTRQPLDYNRQCFAEGASNVVGGFFQALPGSGSLTRSAINFQAGAATRASGVYSAIIVAAVVLVLGPYARFIPKSVLAGLLFITAARLIDWKRLIYAIKATRFDAALVAVTALTAIFIDVEDSILVGVALSIILFLPRASQPGMRELIVSQERIIRERQSGEARQSGLLIYDLEGELFFGAAPQLVRHLNDILAEAERAHVTYVVLRLKRTRHPDMVTVEHLEHFLRDARTHGKVVLLAGLRPDLVRILDNVGFRSAFPSVRIFPEQDEVFSATLNAVRYANELAAEARAQQTNGGTDALRSAAEFDPEHYLV